MKNTITDLLAILLVGIFIFSCTQTTYNDTEKQLNKFIKNHVKVIAPLIKESAQWYYKASVSGKSDEYEKAEQYQIEYQNIYTNKDEFTQLKKIKESKQIKDSLLIRQLDILYNQYLSSQASPSKLEEIIKLEISIEQKFAAYRVEVNGKKITDNEVEEILATSNNSSEVKQIWLASKEIGPIVANDVKKIVKMRNEIAKDAGFRNYYEMSLKLSEQDPAEIENLFDELDMLTRGAYSAEKDKIDQYLAQKFNISIDSLMPWHYQDRFFQKGPKLYNVDLDIYYKDKDVVEISRNFYKSIGLSVDEILKNSDLFEKEGKYQHAYSINIDNSGDVRILCNIKPNATWMSIQLHELGHSIHDKYTDFEAPYLLRGPAHTFTTEAVAMFFGRLNSNPQWLKDFVGITDDEKNKIAQNCFNTLRLEQLVFSRWAQVMYRFEKSMYENPDQNLDELWWTIVSQFQMIKVPVGRVMPDWATKIHIATAPCYYHNYLLGELMASQLHFYIVENILKSDDYKNQSFSNNIEIGAFFKTKIFEPARKYYWNTMIEKATGKKLTPEYYAKQFVQ